MQRTLILLTAILWTTFLQAATTSEMAERIKYKYAPAYIYRVTLADKSGSPYSLKHPSRFLSRRSIERRKRQHLPLDSTDLPVSPSYERQIKAHGGTIVGRSRWQNTLLVWLKDSSRISQLSTLPCVKACKMVWQAPDSITPTVARNKYHDRFEERYKSPQLHGQAFHQINCLHGDRLHEEGLRGEGMMIAILDGGFNNVDRIPAFSHVNICGAHDFVYPASPDLYAESDHGSKVLSAMALDEPFYYVGTAPHARYWLLRCEDQQSEQEVEEDYWTMAAEFADSVGCDLINSSLGYSSYDYPVMSHPLWHLDGRTAFVSRSASLLASKGIVLVNSAGNSGMGPWKKIGVPADADNILTVGSVTDEEPYGIAPFSSIGPSQDGRIKPDVVAFGAPAFLVNGRGVIMEDMGTSFSAPLICGLAACLWQSMPDLPATQLMEIIRQTGHNHEHPDNIYGYGIPDFWKAYLTIKTNKSH